jgi:hypothetical protein
MESKVQVGKLASHYPPQHAAIMAAQKRLLSCKWNTELLGFSKLVSRSIGGLTHYLSLSCLVTTDIMFHTELLKNSLVAGDVSARLLSPLDIQYLTRCAMQSDGNVLERYRHDFAFKTLHEFGAELKSGSILQFRGIMLINNNHWMAFSISPINSTIYLGDSLCPMGDVQSIAAKEAIRTLEWWLDVSYSGSDQPMLPFRIAWLPIAS